MFFNGVFLYLKKRMVKNNTLYLKLNKTGLFFFVFCNAKIFSDLRFRSKLFFQKRLICGFFFCLHVYYGQQIARNSKFLKEEQSFLYQVNFEIKNLVFLIPNFASDKNGMMIIWQRRD